MPSLLSSTSPADIPLDFIVSGAIRERLIARGAPLHEPLTASTPAASQGRGKVARRARLPGRRKTIAHRSVCTAVRVIAAEIVFLAGGRETDGRNRRFAISHIRQIAIYVCHVVLQLTMTDIAAAFGVDRTTVGHACARVEDRRDDRAYDALVASVERIVDRIFGRVGAAQS